MNPLIEGLGRARMTRRDLLALAAASAAAGAPKLVQAAGAAGELIWGIHVSLAPVWFDPADASGIITPFLVLYALHDAVVKPMPDQALAPCLAESVKAAEDGLTYDIVVRKEAKFHNGDSVTAEDVKFSYDRYRGTAHELMKSRVAAVDIVDPQHLRFTLKNPWPDFLTYYATMTGAGWVVPKKYVEKVGDDGTTRLAALKRGEVDIAYSIRGELAEELRNTKGLTLKPAVVQGTFCVAFPDQWDEKSPWHDVRVRKAASLAIDCKGINDALTLGYSLVSGNPFVPDSYEFFWQPPLPVYDPEAAKKLLAEAGHPKGFDAGDYYCDSSYANIGEAVVDKLLAVGIKLKLRPIERAAFIKGYAEKTFKNVIQAGPGAFGNAATRLEMQVVKGGVFSYGSYPDLDALYAQQAVELNRAKREALLHKMQQIVYERTIYAPIWQLAFINGVGPRVGESGFARIARFPYTAPYEDITIKGA